MTTETCNHCEHQMEVDDNAVAVVCPHCGNITGVCANCRANRISADCGYCPFSFTVCDCCGERKRSQDVIDGCCLNCPNAH